MICVPCRKRHHEECPGGSWCDCQHQPSAQSESEPLLNWVRQGWFPASPPRAGPRRRAFNPAAPLRTAPGRPGPAGPSRATSRATRRGN